MTVPHEPAGQLEVVVGTVELGTGRVAQLVHREVGRFSAAEASLPPLVHTPSR
jgi:hypothetical protein